MAQKKSVGRSECGVGKEENMIIRVETSLLAVAQAFNGITH